LEVTSFPGTDPHQVVANALAAQIMADITISGIPLSAMEVSRMGYLVF